MAFILIFVRFFVLYGFLFGEGCGLVGELFSIAEYV